MVIYCHVPNCNKELDKKLDLSFYDIPIDPPIRKKWLKAIGFKDIKKYQDKSAPKICSKHFKDNDYVNSKEALKVLKKCSVPTLCLPSAKIKETKNKTNVRRPKKMVKENITNNVEVKDLEKTKKKRGRPKKSDKTNMEDELKTKKMDLVDSENKKDQEMDCIDPENKKDKEMDCIDPENKKDKEMDCTDPENKRDKEMDCTDPENKKDKKVNCIVRKNIKNKKMDCIVPENKKDSIEQNNTILIEESDDENVECSNIIGEEIIKISVIPSRRNISIQTEDYLHVNSKMYEKNMIDKRFTYFTGFTRKRFGVLVDCLQIKSTQFDEYLSVRDQLTLTLIKYKHSLEIIMLSELYGIRSKIVFQIFIHWTKELYKYFTSIDIWELKHKPDYKFTAIIDCIELPTEPSKTNQEKNKELYSYEKNTFSLKYLLAVDEMNFVIFCSQVYGGAQDDRSMIMDSNFLNKLSDGNFILTDRDFDISDIWATRNVTVEICDSEKMLFPFEISEMESQSQHFIEKIKNLTKKQKILSETVPNYLLPIINEIVFNVNMLSNFNNTNLEL